ncbi:MAG: glycosyltransferase family A protein [Thermodesulfovibrionales bacterium]|jgi:glycosyltransferase involved in cell wall biosynthesis
MNNPLTSVIIPVYNGERYLAEAIESVLAQTYRPIEIIVVDDGSTDGSADVAKGFHDNIRYVFQPNSGPPAARNTGLRMANGNVIGFIDADDLWSNNKLSLQLERLDNNSSAEIVLGHLQFLLYRITDSKHEWEVSSDPQIALTLGSGVFRKSVFDKVGLFDETLYYGDDWDWFMRARELGVSMLIHKEVTLFYRRHKHNLTNQKKIGDTYIIRILKNSIDRRRHKSGLDRELSKVSSYKEEYNKQQDTSAGSKNEDCTEK